MHNKEMQNEGKADLKEVFPLMETGNKECKLLHKDNKTIERITGIEDFSHSHNNTRTQQQTTNQITGGDVMVTGRGNELIKDKINGHNRQTTIGNPAGLTITLLPIITDLETTGIMKEPATMIITGTIRVTEGRFIVPGTRAGVIHTCQEEILSFQVFYSLFKPLVLEVMVTGIVMEYIIAHTTMYSG
jgi:hypothetical protein